MKCPKSDCACEDVPGMLEFGKEVVLSSSDSFLFAELLLFPCLEKGKGFCSFKEQFLDPFSFSFIFLLLPLFCSYLSLEPFDLKKVCDLHFLQILQPPR